MTGTLTAVASSGVATFSGLAAPTLAQTGLKLTFTDGSLASAVDATSITVNPGAMSQLVMNPTTIASATAGTSVSGSFTSITAKDANGNVCSSGPNAFTGTVTFGGTAGATGTSAAFSAGVLTTFPTLTPTVAGSGKTITATSGSVVGTTTITTVNPATASKLVMKTEPSSSVAAGGAFSTQPAVYVEDTYGNVVTTRRQHGDGHGPGGHGSVDRHAHSGGVQRRGDVQRSGRTDAGASRSEADVHGRESGERGGCHQHHGQSRPGGETGFYDPARRGTGGTAWGTQPVVTVQDQFGNTVTTDTSTVTVAIQNNAGPGGVLTGTLTKAAGWREWRVSAPMP